MGWEKRSIRNLGLQKNLFFELSKDITLIRTDRMHKAASINVV